MSDYDRMLITRVGGGLIAAALFLGNLQLVRIRLGLVSIPVPLSILVVLIAGVGAAGALRYRALMIEQLHRRDRRGGAGHGARVMQPARARASQRRPTTHSTWLEDRRSPFD